MGRHLRVRLDDQRVIPQVQGRWSSRWKAGVADQLTLWEWVREMRNWGMLQTPGLSFLDFISFLLEVPGGACRALERLN